MRLLFVVYILFSSVSVLANPVSIGWQGLDDKYHLLIEQQQFYSAYQVALTLNEMAPADSEVLLYLVFAGKKSGSKLPSWVMSKPWPSASNQDRFNRLIAEEILQDDK